MKIKYETLFTVACRHPFYADERCRSLALRPTGACRKLLRRYDLLYRETVGGGTVSYAQKEHHDPIFTAVDTPITLTFALTNSDPNLLNFTEISLPHVFLAEKLFHFSTLNGRVSDAGMLYLHPGTTVSEDDQLDVLPSIFTGTLPEDESPQIIQRLAQKIAATPDDQQEIARLTDLYKACLDGNLGTATFLQIFDQFGKKVWDARLTPGQTYSVDLSSRLPGWYRMTKGKKLRQGNGEIFVYEEHDFYVSTFPPEKVWGLVEIVVAGPQDDAQIPEAFRLFKDGHIRPLDFEIAFANRATFWRYYVMNPSSDTPSLDEARVSGTTKMNGNGTTNGRAEIRFDSAGDQVVNGKKAWVFESQEPIPLWERPAGKHTFTFNNRKLPYAGTTLIKTEADPDAAAAEARKIYSEIFVYL